MPLVPPTDRPRLPTDATAPGWDYLPWWPGMDDDVIIDLVNRLAPGESLTNVSTQLLRVPAWGETDYVDYPTGMIGTPVVDGTMVRQRCANLEAGRTYELWVTFGDVGNVRTAPGVIKVAEGPPP